ncbi:hypothetical protein QR680_014628 [Steinernema hermaphroditum]|uniref:Cysteine synthase n=1 Tax=Steinernema hermaphroditum TaxID=289476 RepID=A0AA39I9M9_9BILA|nr:hypothetical protein QR680_014628 [Steinernema hermaphroditum]
MLSFLLCCRREKVTPIMSRDSICADASELVGNTPMVYLNKVTEGLPAKIAVKVEYMSPGCSVKDRISHQMITEAEQTGLLVPGKSVIVEGTSGNTGIGLAMIAAARGYKCIIVMGEPASLERRVVLRAYGADVVLTDPMKGFKGVQDRADQLTAIIPNAAQLGQFTNPINPKTHYLTTGPEIWRQTGGKVDICVFGVGTGGTLTGVGQYLQEQKPEVQMFAVEPAENAVLNGEKPGPHDIQGIGTGTIPPVLNREIVAEALKVKSADAIAMSKRLCAEEGLMVGISSGANVAAAIELAKRPENAGKLIVTLLASFGERYLSTKLYKDISDESVAMKRSTVEENYENFKEKYEITSSLEELAPYMYTSH